MYTVGEWLYTVVPSVSVPVVTFVNTVCTSCAMGDRLAQDETDRNIEIWKIKRVGYWL